MANTSEKIAENVLLLAISRVSMALAIPLIGFISWLGSQYLESKFEIVNDRVAAVERKADDASSQASQTNDRLISVETKQSQDALAAAKFQDATLTRLDRVQDSLVGLSNTVAALTATLQAITDDRRKLSEPGR
jgi:hypothetical protein